jgi:class 3 adenylate cyclase/pimeloyl-ACP methyl ester carboxylesterase
MKLPDTGVPKTHWARTIDGVWIAYHDIGKGPLTLIFTNDMYSHLEIYWELPRFARFMNRLARGVRVLNFDRRGTGMSDRVELTPTLESRIDDAIAVMDAAEVDRASVYGWGAGSAAMAALQAGTHPERTSALLIDGWLTTRWAPDFPWGVSPEEWDIYLARLVAIWGDDDHALEIGQLTCGNRPEDGMWNDAEFVRWHSRLARYSATPGSFEAFERYEYELDARHIAGQVRVPTAILTKEGGSPEDVRIAEYNATLIPGARLIRVPGAASIPMFDGVDGYTDAMLEFMHSVADEERAMDRMLATVIFTDIVDSTAKACELGDRRWTELLDRHHQIVRAMLARYRGVEVDTAGDGFLATFDGPARAVKCAQGICEAVRPLGLEVRAGCHTGEIELTGSDVGGIAVHIGARVAALAGPSEVLVSSTVKDLVAGSGIVFEDRGEHELKGVPEMWRLYAALPAAH